MRSSRRPARLRLGLRSRRSRRSPRPMPPSRPPRGYLQPLRRLHSDRTHLRGSHPRRALRRQGPRQRPPSRAGRKQTTHRPRRRTLRGRQSHPAPVPPAPVTRAPAARAQVPVSPAAARAAAPEVAAVVAPRVAPTVIPPPGRVPSGVAAAPVATAGVVNQPESGGADSARPAAGVSFLGARRRDAEPLLATPSLPATASTAPAPRRAPPSAAPSSSVAVAVADAGPSSVELDTVFDMSAADVVPPVFVRRQLADVVAHAGSAAAYLVLVVSQTGQVEQVRLEPPTAQVRDRLLLPAAKAWQFTPATKDGRPVRYRLRVPVPAAQ